MTIPVEHTRVHEAGHVLALLSCGHPLLHLDEVHVVCSETAAGGCVLKGWWDDDDDGWPRWFHPGPDRAADATLALMAFGGMAAEIAAFGERPDRGWSDDVLSASLRLAALSGVSPRFMKTIAARLDEAGHSETVIHDLCACIAGAVQNMSGADIGTGLKALEDEAVRRARENMAAIKFLADELARVPRLTRENVHDHLAGIDGYTVLGPPSIPVLFEG